MVGEIKRFSAWFHNLLAFTHWELLLYTIHAVVASHLMQSRNRDRSADRSGGEVGRGTTGLKRPLGGQGTKNTYLSS